MRIKFGSNKLSEGDYMKLVNVKEFVMYLNLSIAKYLKHSSSRFLVFAPSHHSFISSRLPVFVSSHLPFVTTRLPVFVSSLLLSLLPSIALAQITGTVLDADTKAPLKNALVSLKSTGDLVLTNENGVFTLTKTAVSTIKMKQPVPAAPFTIQRNNLQLTISTPNTPVQLVVLNLNGQIVYKTTKTLQSGSHNIDLSKALSTSAIYILDITINKTKFVTRLFPSSRLPIFASSSSQCSSSRLPAFASSSTLDTLIVSKYLYTPQTTPVAATITVLLQKPATPPPPPGMKAIPGGKFMRGSDRPFATNDEQPIKEITLSPFYIDSTEVTQADYISLLRTELQLESVEIVVPVSGKGNNYPVWNINWYGAALYCNARSKRDGLDTAYAYDSKSGVAPDSCILTNVTTDFTKNGYRLPTEAEWEYAARSGTTTDYYWGNYTKQDLVTPTNYAWYDIDIAHPVAMKIPNSFGLYDMAGNVYEFVNDYYDGNTYNSEEVLDPKGPSITSNGRRGQRGGCWDSELAEIRSSNRIGVYPEKVLYWNGFRVALPNK
jgi:formylglycine-generating enzyme required for sulfatase activity